MADELAGLPSYEEKVDSKAAAKAAKAEVARVQEAAKNVNVPFADPAMTDYTFGKPVGEKGVHKLPNGTVIETN